MTGEQDRTLEALQTAIQMEIDGRECYLGAIRQSGNEAGRRLLRSLADEEERHRQEFQRIYEAIRLKKAWPAVKPSADRASQLQTTLLEACRLTGTDVAGAAAEFSTIATAVGKEKESSDYYRRRSQAAVYDAEREFYAALAEEERGHELILLDYEEYLTDPVGWFTRTEHHFLDGG